MQNKISNCKFCGEEAKLIEGCGYIHIDCKNKCLAYAACTYDKNEVKKCIERYNKTPLQKQEIKWTKEQLQSQRDEILEEFNFHAVLNFLILNEGKLKIRYLPESVRELKGHARGFLDGFIDNYLKTGSDFCYRDIWQAEFTNIHTVKLPLLTLYARYDITSECDAWQFGNAILEKSK